MESSLIRIQTLKLDSDRQVNEHYRTKVQLEEQLSDNEWQLAFCQGTVEALAQMEIFLSSGLQDDSQEQLPQQALLRLQSLRVEVYCQLSESFRDMIVLKKEWDKNNRDLYFYRGVLSVNGAEPLEVQNLVRICCEQTLLLTEEIDKNDRKLHFQRGMIAALDEAERIINEELNPKIIPSAIPTSPGMVGPDFEGKAMEKPDKVKFPDQTSPNHSVSDHTKTDQTIPNQTKSNGIKFPDYAQEYNLPNHPEYQPGAYQHTKLGEVQ